MTELEIVQDLFNALGMRGTLRHPVNIQAFASAAMGLREMSRGADSDPRHVKQCIAHMCQSIGSPYFTALIDSPRGVGDIWLSYWCPQPPGVELHRADCPAGTTPLWTNGAAVVFCRPVTDKHGNELFDFGVC